MEDGRRRKASTTRNGGRTAPRLSLRVAPAVEATGEDPRSAESAVDPSQADRPVVVWDFDVCLSDDLAAGSQQRDEPAAVLGEPAVAVSRAGELAASGYAGPPAGEDRGEPDPGEPDRPDPTRSEEHTSELQSPDHLVCRLLLEKKKTKTRQKTSRHKATWTNHKCLH